MLKQILTKAIVCYQKFFSGLKSGCCKHYPSCSNYALLALQKYNIFYALVKIIKRLLTCNYFCRSRLDLP